MEKLINYFKNIKYIKSKEVTKPYMIFIGIAVILSAFFIFLGLSATPKEEDKSSAMRDYLALHAYSTICLGNPFLCPASVGGLYEELKTRDKNTIKFNNKKDMELGDVILNVEISPDRGNDNKHRVYVTMVSSTSQCREMFKITPQTPGLNFLGLGHREKGEVIILKNDEACSKPRKVWVFSGTNL